MEFSWLALIAIVASASDPIDLNADRPDFTESTSAVPPREVQVEGGMTMDWTGGEPAANAPETLLRFGLSDRIEARLGVPDREWIADEAGWGPAYLGAKLELEPGPANLELALIPGLRLPVDRGWSGDVTGELVVAWAEATSGLGGGIKIEGVGAGDSDLLGYGATLSYGFEIFRDVGGFVEYAGAFAQHVRPEHLLHVGAVLRTGPRSQIDAHCGLGERRFFVGAGWVHRF